MSTKEREQLHSEFSILNSLRHPNIVAYYHRDHIKSSQDLHLYMEYCGGGDLAQVIDNLRKNNQYADESYVWSIFSQLVTALYRCHYGVNSPDVGTDVFCPVVKPAAASTKLKSKTQLMILHRDLKPENGKPFSLCCVVSYFCLVLTVVVFLGEDSSVKLGDFGLSKIMASHDFASTYVGTPFYMSPEICAAERYTLYSDIWSLGCVIFELCARAPPFNARTHFHLVQKIKEGRRDSIPPMYSPELRSVIENCLKTNPSLRPDTATLLNLPMVRLMRKEREVVELGKLMKMREEQAKIKFSEAETKASDLDTERQKFRHEIESTVRREWELKARLEIDRQVQLEMVNMQKQFDAELVLQVEKEVQQRLESAVRTREPTSASPDEAQYSSVSTSIETEFPSSTELSSVFLDSPPVEKMRLLPPKKLTRTPFTRARTQFDSPMDVQMVDPSPMSIAGLALSPRTKNAAPTAVVSNIPSGKNIFALAATQNTKPILNLQPLSTLVPSSLDFTLEERGDDDEEDWASELPTPSRLPEPQSDPFKVQPPTSRPGLRRQNTAPSRRINNNAPGIFVPRLGRPPRIPSPVNMTDSGSPVRKNPLKIPCPGGEHEMFKAVMQRKLLVNGGGRTLVELAQGRVGETPASPNHNQKTEVVDEPTEVMTWNPEIEEMPSPFLVRGGGKGMRRL